MVIKIIVETTIINKIATKEMVITEKAIRIRVIRNLKVLKEIEEITIDIILIMDIILRNPMGMEIMDANT